MKMATSPTKKTTTTKRKTSTRAPRATTAKTAPKTAAKAAAKPAAKPAATPSVAEAAPIPKVVKVSEPAAVKADLKKKELLDEVVLRSGVKKKDAKPVVEAMLALLGESLADGRELNLQPFGKLRINRAEEHANYRIVICKLRQQIGAPGTAGGDDADPVADAAE